MFESFCISKVFDVKVENLFDSWLDSKEHAAFTGGKATIDPRENGSFTAWDGYITGKTLKVEKYSRIVQTWRTTEFSIKDKDSILEVLFKKVKEGTKLTICHSELPEGQGENYKDGWIDYYFEPMEKYFKEFLV